MTFHPLCALEYMAMADRENVQTGLLAWVLGNESPLDVRRRVAVLSAITGKQLPPVRATKSETEDQDIDLVVTCELESGGKVLIAIENKLKAQESARQLERYDAYLKKHPVYAKVFLTLLGDTPKRGSTWVGASYAQLVGALDSTAPLDDGAEDRYVLDARSMMRRLVEAVNRVSSEPRFTRYLFKHDSQTIIETEEKSFAAYVKQLRLKRLLQRAWCKQVERHLGAPLEAGWSTHIATGSKSASALLDVAKIVGPEGQKVRVGLQLQDLVLKAFCAPHPYPKPVTAQQRNLVAQRLQQVRSVLSLDAKHKPSSSRDRGFRSFSIKRNIEEQYSVIAWADVVRGYYQRLAEVQW